MDQSVPYVILELIPPGEQGMTTDRVLSESPGSADLHLHPGVVSVKDSLTQMASLSSCYHSPHRHSELQANQAGDVTEGKKKVRKSLLPTEKEHASGSPVHVLYLKQKPGQKRS